MRIAAWLARFVCNFVLAIVGVYLVIAICVAVFILAGEIVPGEPMYFDLLTPSLLGVIEFIAISGAVVALLAFASNKLNAFSKATHVSKVA